MILVEGTIILSLTSILHCPGFVRITLDPRRAMCFTTFIQHGPDDWNIVFDYQRRDPYDRHFPELLPNIQSDKK